MREADLGLDFRRPGSPAQGAAQLVDAPGDMPSNTTETANP